MSQGERLARREAHRRWKAKNPTYREDYYRANPWMKAYKSAKQRCENPKINDYESYGGRGIRFLITADELKSLWARDKASKMSRPSIDRINSDGPYSLENCRFVELSDNARAGAILGNLKREKCAERHPDKPREIVRRPNGEGYCRLCYLICLKIRRRKNALR